MFTRRFRHLVFFNETMATRPSSETAYQANVKDISSFQPNKLLISITTICKNFILNKTGLNIEPIIY